MVVWFDELLWCFGIDECIDFLMDGISWFWFMYNCLFGCVHGSYHVVEALVILWLCMDDRLSGWWLVGGGGWCVEMVVMWW